MIHLHDLAIPAWGCIHFISSSGFELASASLVDLRLAAFRANASGVVDERDLLARIGVAMQFPDYFGRNWDALDECLRDMEWCPSKGYILILDNSAFLWKSSPQAGGKLVESWLLAAERWSRDEISFHLVFVW